MTVDYQIPSNSPQISGGSSSAITGVAVKTATYGILSTDTAFLLVMNAAGSTAFNLPSSVPAAGWFVFLQNENTGACSVTPPGSVDIDGVNAAVVLYKGEGMLVTTDGTNYFTSRGVLPALSGDLSLAGLVATVVALQGNAVASGVPGGTGYVLTWSGTQWQAESLSVIGNANASQLRGININTAVGTPGSAQNGYAIVYNYINNDYELGVCIPTASTINITTGSMAPGASQSGSVSAFKMCSLWKIAWTGGPSGGGTGAIRIQIYSTNAALSADAARGPVPPTPGTPHGVCADLYLTNTGVYVSPWMMSPLAELFNDDSGQAATLYYRLTNIDTQNNEYSVTLYVVQQES